MCNCKGRQKVMIERIIQPLKKLLISSLFLSASCSQDLSEMSIQERSLHQSDRYSTDKKSDIKRKPLQILEFSGVSEGMQVIDLLGGGGYYTELFDYIVGNTGKVYLQNNSLFLRFSQEEIQKRLKNNRLSNTIRLDSEFADMKLPTNTDLIFIGLSYHDIYVPREDPVITADRDEFFTQVLAALKPGGNLLIIDHNAKPGSGKSTTKKLHRIEEQWAIKDIESAGFTFIKSSDILKNPKDDYSKDIWSKAVIYKTDKFIHLYQKPIN